MPEKLVGKSFGFTLKQKEWIDNLGSIKFTGFVRTIVDAMMSMTKDEMFAFIADVEKKIKVK